MFLKLYTFTLVLLYPAISHKVPIFFTKLPNSDTHLTNLYNADQNLQPGIEFQHPKSLNNNNDNNLNNNNINKTTDINNNNVNNSVNNNNNRVEISNKELSEEAYKLNEELKDMGEAKDKMKELEKSEKDLSEKLSDTNYEKLNELEKHSGENMTHYIQVQLVLINVNIILELREQPIVLIAKSSQDDKRKANQLAHLQGFEDLMNNITSPCNLMEELREKSVNKNDDMRGKYEREQKVLDSMNWKERLNYDNNMIEHYESIMSEIEEGIRRAEEEIENSWNQNIY
ncbi:uncharacterized protein TA11770 [Theileria annulata]|uniref:Uncharacterized protein n=1 Tax=Theileria annulata TaxID=5874 RepID=Q4UDN6_THEAN|nr:uncharacterized protein TA11770 [Theileria annulata]CAI74803.1 hypothetical protein TA11770 [Theileria annulata]|eukprot:XP_952535.1 hypothetical protein TA11770 [Theileria annulata]